MWTGPEQPELLPGLRAWYDDFQELSTDRQLGVVAGPIPRSSIVEHTRGWPDDDAEMFRICMRRMDALYLSFDPELQAQSIPVEMSPQDKLKAIFGDRID